MSNEPTFADYIAPVTVIDTDIVNEDEEERKGRKIMRNNYGSQTIYATISEGVKEN